MYFVTASKRQGFTLIELIVVIGIIGLFAGIVLASLNQARVKARDGKRLADIKQLQLSFKLYAESNGSYPSDSEYDNGVEIGVGGTIDTAIAPFQSNPPADPRTDDGNTYRYWYDSQYNCGGTNTPVLAVRTMEHESNANFGEVCGSGSGGQGGFSDATYIIPLR